MTTEEAKKILSFYRPGTADERDPAFNEALSLARRPPENARWLTKPDPELMKWFDDHCAEYAAGRDAFRQVAVPAGLKEQILAERKIIPFPAPVEKASRRWRIIAIAAAIALCLGALPFFVHLPQPRSDFSACRSEMIAIAISPYAMDLLSTNQDQVRAFLAQRNAPANYALPANMNSLPIVGCAVKSFDNRAVSMICFRTGRPMRAGDTTDLWLFIIDNTKFNGQPAGAERAFAQENGAIAGSWTRDQHTYILLGRAPDDKSIPENKPVIEQYMD